MECEVGGAEAGFKGESGDRLGLPACVGLLMHIHEYLLLLFFRGGGVSVYSFTCMCVCILLCFVGCLLVMGVYDPYCYLLPEKRM